jgi:hypothetical protein
MREVVVDKAVNVMINLGKQTVLLDNQAEVGIIYPAMLEDVMVCDYKLRVIRVGGLQFIVLQQGYIPDFFPVYASEQTKAKALSFAEVEDKYPIMFIPCTCFIVHLPG